MDKHLSLINLHRPLCLPLRKSRPCRTKLAWSLFGEIRRMDHFRIRIDPNPQGPYGRIGRRGVTSSSRAPDRQCFERENSTPNLQTECGSVETLKAFVRSGC